MMIDDEMDNVEPICQEQTSSGADLSEGTVILSPKMRLEITESEVCLRPTNRSPHTKVTPSVTFCSAGEPPTGGIPYLPKHDNDFHRGSIT